MATGQPLEGKVAVVTGASSGIGADGARRLAEAGATVVLAARRQDRLQELAEQLNQRGRARGIVAVTDVTREADRVALVDRARQVTGRVDILVNNAGFGWPGAVEETELDWVRQQYETNFFAALHLMQLVIPEMRRRRSGRIINMSSINGRIVTPGLAFYSATKYSLEAVSDAARLELRPFGVHVALIEPGMIKTEIWAVGRDLGLPLLQESSPYYPLYRTLLALGERAERSGADPDVVGRAIVDAAVSPRPKARYVMPLDGKLTVAISVLPAAVRDPLVRLTLRLLGGQSPTLVPSHPSPYPSPTGEGG